MQPASITQSQPSKQHTETAGDLTRRLHGPSGMHVRACAALQGGVHACASMRVSSAYDAMLNGTPRPRSHERWYIWQLSSPCATKNCAPQ